MMKIIKVEHCNGACKYFDYSRVRIKNIGYFKCNNSKSYRKNGNLRRINHKILIKGNFPTWCPLDDYNETS